MTFPFKVFRPRVAIARLWLAGPALLQGGLIGVSPGSLGSLPFLPATGRVTSIVSTNPEVTKVVERWMEMEKLNAKEGQRKN